jgi:hypothetical protein
MALFLIACLVCFVIVIKWHLKSTVKDPDLYDYPEAWKEWRVREKSEKSIQEPSAEHPDISEGLKFDTNLSEKDSKEPRGEMVMLVGPDGGVGGNWNGFYHKGRTRSFQIMVGGFDGRVYPAKIRRNETGEEKPSMLYLMTKGEFLVQEADSEKGIVNNIAGDIYVRGWLSTDYVLTGEVTITSDEKYFETFTFKSYGSVRKGGALF